MFGAKKFLLFLLVQEDLIRSILAAIGPKDRVPGGLHPGPLPLDPHLWTAELRTPAAAEDGRAVQRMVPHEVELSLGRVEPLVDGGALARVDATVEVPRNVNVHLEANEA